MQQALNVGAAASNGSDQPVVAFPELSKDKVGAAASSSPDPPAVGFAELIAELELVAELEAEVHRNVMDSVLLASLLPYCADKRHPPDTRFLVCEGDFRFDAPDCDTDDHAARMVPADANQGG